MFYILHTQVLLGLLSHPLPWVWSCDFCITFTHTQNSATYKAQPTPKRSKCVCLVYLWVCRKRRFCYYIILGGCKRCFLSSVIISDSCFEDAFCVKMLAAVTAVIWSSPAAVGSPLLSYLELLITILVTTVLTWWMAKASGIRLCFPFSKTTKTLKVNSYSRKIKWTQW